MSRFKFNSEKFYQDLQDYIVKLVDELAADYYIDIQSKLSSSHAKEDLVLEPTVIEGNTDNTEYHKGIEFVNARIRAYVFAVLDSFGIGTGMDTSSRYLEDYRNSEYWNPARNEKTIVGRPKGQYTDIFGDDDAYSPGHYEGKPIPRSYNLPASHAIQSVEDWLIKNGETRVERHLKQFIDQYISENAHKYFTSGGK